MLAVYYEKIERRGSMKLKILWISLIVVASLFPSICLSETKTVQSEYCDVYSGDMQDKEELDKFRKTVRKKAVEDGIHKIVRPSEGHFSNECIRHVVKNYLQKVAVVSHTEKDGKVCDKVQITSDTEAVKKYLSQKSCKEKDIFDYLIPWWVDVIFDD